MSWSLYNGGSSEFERSNGKEVNDLLGRILIRNIEMLELVSNQLKLLNARFEESFETDIDLEDLENDDF